MVIFKFTFKSFRQFFCAEGVNTLPENFALFGFGHGNFKSVVQAGNYVQLGIDICFRKFCGVVNVFINK